MFFLSTFFQSIIDLPKNIKEVKRLMSLSDAELALLPQSQLENDHGPEALANIKFASDGIDRRMAELSTISDEKLARYLLHAVKLDTTNDPQSDYPEVLALCAKAKEYLRLVTAEATKRQNSVCP